MTAEHEPAAHTVDASRGHTVDTHSDPPRGHCGPLLVGAASVHGGPADTPTEHLETRIAAGHITTYDLAAELLRRPAWQADALCKEYPNVTWFPERGDDVRKALAICDRCLVKAECLQYATDLEIDVGLWGGTSARTRVLLRRTTRTAQGKAQQ